jgi:hypothetical protein
LFALLIAAVVVITTMQAAVGSHEELLWPENVSCGHAQPDQKILLRFAVDFPHLDRVAGAKLTRVDTSAELHHAELLEFFRERERR